MQRHKAQTHSGSHANLAVNRAHKRLALKRQARVTISGNRAFRRAPLRAAALQAKITAQSPEAIVNAQPTA